MFLLLWGPLTSLEFAGRCKWEAIEFISADRHFKLNDEFIIIQRNVNNNNMAS